ncbi:hypothetical protein QQ045_030543 [Rhodiola kirilowii]
MTTRQQVILRQHPSARFAEVAGGTAADCAVICCCCPFAILNVVFLTLYTLPVGICRKLLRSKQRRRLLKKEVVCRRRCTCGCEVGEVVGQIYPVGNCASLNEVEKLDHEEEEIMRLEKEMWATFYSTGFWRSPSQKDN